MCLPQVSMQPRRCSTQAPRLYPLQLRVRQCQVLVRWRQQSRSLRASQPLYSIIWVTSQSLQYVHLYIRSMLIKLLSVLYDVEKHHTSRWRGMGYNRKTTSVSQSCQWWMMMMMYCSYIHNQHRHWQLFTYQSRRTTEFRLSRPKDIALLRECLTTSYVGQDRKLTNSLFYTNQS